METIIKYDRSKKLYNLIDTTSGAVIGTAESGKENKATLEIQQLRYEAELHGIDPDWLLEEIRNLATDDRLQGRAFKAGQLVASGAVQRLGDGRFVVRSQSGDGAYAYKVINNGRRRCECKDFELGGLGHSYGAPVIDGEPRCKHILATEIMIDLRLSRRAAEAVEAYEHTGDTFVADVVAGAPIESLLGNAGWAEGI